MYTKPLVSILITTYNRAPFVIEAIESVINSTFQEWELIIVDDHSVDNTSELVKKYLSNNRIRYFKNERNLGQFENRNKAATLARGEYLKYLDSDDMLYPHSLAIMVAAMEAFSDASLAVPYDKDIVYKPYPFSLDSNQAIMEHFEGGNFLSHGPSGLIFKKKDFIKVKGFEPQKGILADTHLALKIAGQSKKIAFFQKDLIYWRVHKEQVTVGQSNVVKMIIERYLIIKDFLLNHSKALSISQVEYIDYVYRKITSRHIVRHLLIGKFRSAFKIKTALKISMLEIIKALLFFRIKLGLKYKNRF